MSGLARYVLFCVFGSLSFGRAQDLQPDPADQPKLEQAASLDASSPPSPPIGSTGEALRSLGHEEYQVREAASRYLWLKGAEVREQIAPLTQSKDPEVAYRARALITKIESGLLPSTSKEVASLVERYHERQTEGKMRIMSELQQRGAYSQLFSLFRAEKDPQTREEIQPFISRLTPVAVRAALLANNFTEAFRLLELSGQSERSLRIWASILDWQGAAQAVLDSIEGDDPLAQKKRFALHRALGNKEQVIQMARAMEREDVLLPLALLRGETEAFFSELSTNNELEMIRQPVWELEQVRATQAQARETALVKKLAEENKGAKPPPLPSELAMEYLALGRRGEALEILGAEGKKEHFALLLANSDYREALALFGLDWEEGVLSKWIDQEHQKGGEIWWFNAEESTLWAVASILLQLGQHDAIYRMLLPLWENLSEQEEKEDFLSQLVAQQYVSAALLLVQAHVDPAEQERYKTAFLSSTKIYQRCWEISLDSHPELDFSQRVALILELVRGRPVDQTVGAPLFELLATIETMTTSLEGVAREEWEQHLKELYVQGGFHQKLLALLETRYAREKNFQRCYELVNQYLYLNRTEQAAQLTASDVFEDRSNDLMTKLYKAGVLSKGGRREEAETLFREVDLLLLDDPNLLVGATEWMLRIGLLPKAKQYFEKALLITQASGKEFSRWPVLLETGKLLYARSKAWNQAHLCAQGKLFLLLDQALTPPGRRSKGQAQGYFLQLAQERFHCDLYRAKFLAEKGQNQSAKALFGKAALPKIGNGVLGDEFFPFLLEHQYEDLLQEVYQASEGKLAAVIERFSSVVDVKNTLAWISARAALNLARAQKEMETVLRADPRNAAYLDTTAEVYFALENREKALEYSKKAWQSAQSGTGAEMIKSQYIHFRDDPFPR